MLPRNTTSLALSIPSQEVFTLFIYHLSIWLITSRQPVAPRSASLFSTFAVNGLCFLYFTFVNPIASHGETLKYFVHLLYHPAPCKVNEIEAVRLAPCTLLLLCFLTEKIEIVFYSAECSEREKKENVTGVFDIVYLWVMKIKKPMILCARSTSTARNANHAEITCRRSVSIVKIPYSHVDCTVKMTLLTSYSTIYFGKCL